MEYLFSHPPDTLKNQSKKGLLDISAQGVGLFQLTDEVVQIVEALQEDDFDLDLFVDSMFSVNQQELDALDDSDIDNEDSFIAAAAAANSAAAAAAAATIATRVVYKKKRKLLHLKPDPPTASVSKVVSDTSIRAIALPLRVPCLASDLPQLSYAGGEVQYAWTVSLLGYAEVPIMWYVKEEYMVIGTELFGSEEGGVVVPYNMSEGAFVVTERFLAEPEEYVSDFRSLALRYPDSVLARFDSQAGPKNIHLFVYKTVSGRDKTVKGAVTFFVTAVVSRTVLANQVLCV